MYASTWISDNLTDSGSITLTVTTELQFQPAAPMGTLTSDDPVIAMELTNDPRLFTLDNVGLAKGHAQVFKLLRYMTLLAEIEWPDNAAPTRCSEVVARMMCLQVPVDEGPVVSCISESARLGAVVLCFLPFKNDYPSPEYVPLFPYRTLLTF